MAEGEELNKLFCPGCRYDLTGIQSAHCPECGTELDWAKLRESKIPWVHRRELGRVRAFLRTVWLVIREPSVVGQEVHRPVNNREAQRFRWVVVVCATLPLWGWVLAAQLIWGPEPRRLISLEPRWLLVSTLPAGIDLAVCFYAGMTIWPVPWIVSFACVAGWTGAASYFFNVSSSSQAKQDRVTAVSYYTCAPLAALIIPSTLFGLSIWGYHYCLVDDLNPLPPIIGTLLVLAWISLGVVGVLLFRGALGILSGVGSGATLRMLWAVVFLPGLWVAITFMTLGLVPALCGLLRMVIYSYSA